ncbi:MAG: phosphoglycolate phosphatase [Bauldia sp.]|nr:phosphoglycolate phosphatase [Bauldia sp.]
MDSSPVLALDLDGTLVDTAPDLVATLNMLLERDGLRTLSMAEATEMIGAGVQALIERGLKAVGADRTPEQIDRLFDEFVAYYEPHIADGSRPYPGVVAAIDRFRARGWRLAVCTNKLEGLSRALLRDLGIIDRFAAVCGGDTFDIRKPDGQHLLRTIAKAGGDPMASVMVGDSETDVKTARNAGLPVVCVDFGYTPVPVATFGPDRLISHFDQLDEAVDAILAARTT